MPDVPSAFEDMSYTSRSLENSLHEALQLAVTSSPQEAAVRFAKAIAPHAGLAIFFMNMETESPDELVILGADIGALFVGAELGNDADWVTASLYCRTGFGNGREISIETEGFECASKAEFLENLQPFFALLEITLLKHDVHVSRARPSDRRVTMTAPPQVTSDMVDTSLKAEPTLSKLTRSRWGVFCATLLMFVVILASGWVLAGKLWHGQQERSAVNNSMVIGHLSPQQDAAGQSGVSPNANGIGGVQVVLGGFGSTKGPDLKSFGIKAGAEVANAVGD